MAKFAPNVVKFKCNIGRPARFQRSIVAIAPYIMKAIVVDTRLGYAAGENVNSEIHKLYIVYRKLVEMFAVSTHTPG